MPVIVARKQRGQERREKSCSCPSLRLARIYSAYWWRIQDAHLEAHKTTRSEIKTARPAAVQLGFCKCKWATHQVTPRAATQELPSISWNQTVRCRVDSNPPLVRIPSQIIHSISPHPISLTSILIVLTHLRLGLPSGLFHSRFPTNNPYALFSSHSCYIPCPSHPALFAHSNYT
jgi:hypothetical protein